MTLTNSAGDLLDGVICVGETITVTCNVLNDNTRIATRQYQWSIDGGKWKIGNDTYTVRAPSDIQSTVTVSCEVFIKLHSGIEVCGRNKVIIQPSDSKTLHYNGYSYIYCIVMYLMIREQLAMSCIYLPVVTAQV